MTDDHGSAFYREALDAADRAPFEDAHHVEGLRDEVALLRLQVRRLIQETDTDPRVLQAGIRLLIQALAAQHRISGEQADGLGDVLAGVIEGFATLASPLDTGDAA